MDGFELLQLASLETDLPFILISADARLNVMMRGFSLGAIDYLIKPLRIEDLRYVWFLWKHIAKTRLSDKEAPKCMKHDTLAIEEPKSSSNSKKRKVAVISADARLNVMMGGFSLGATDYLMKPLCIEDIRYVWILWKHIAKTRLSDKEAPKCMKHDTLAIEEPKSSSNSKKRKVAAKLNDDGNDDNSDDESDNDDSSSSKRTCLVWTTELHQKFLSFVNQIGTNKAVPKQILELMNVPGITRENVASHLQKYRLLLRKLSQAKQNEFLRVCSGEAVRTGQQKSLNFPALCGPDHIPAQTLASLEPVILDRSSRSLSVPPMGHQNLQHASMQGWPLMDCQTNMFNGSPHSKIVGSNNSSHCAINMQIPHLLISSQASNIFQGGDSAVLLSQNSMEAPSRLLNNSPAWSNPVFMSLNSIVVSSQP